MLSRFFEHFSDFFGCCAAHLCQVADLFCDNRKTFAILTGTGSFDGGIGTSYVQIAAIPQLTGLSTGTFRIPEAGATVRQAVLEIVGDSGGLQSSASLGVPSVRVNGSTVYAHTSETTTGAGSSRFERFLVSAPSPAFRKRTVMARRDGRCGTVA